MLEGKIASGVHRFDLRVYYEDTDFSGYVYHSNYLKFCERARSDFLRVLGIDQNILFTEGGAFVVRRMTCEFLRPARFDDVLTVESLPGQAAGARFEIKQRVLRGDEVLFSADVTAVFIDARGRPKRLTPALLAAFSQVAS